MLARTGRLRMLRGLPFSNVLGLWSEHSCSSSLGSGPPRGSCSWFSSCSSGPTSFSCEPVWCMCAHEWSARCPGCNAHTRWYQMTMTWCIDDLGGHFYKVFNIIQEQAITLSIYYLLLYKLPSSVTSHSQDASKIHQTPFILLNLYITIHNFFIHF